MATTTKQVNILSDEERSARRAEDRRRIQTSVEALRSSDGWKRWLRARRHFHEYSFRNQLLIASQCEGATHVAGFRAWLKLGYHVRKGESAIRISAPCPPSKRRLAAWRAAGGREEDRPRMSFRFVAVFDRSQVEPLPEFPGGPVELESPHQPVGGDGLADRLPPLVEFADSLELEVAVEKIPGSPSGYFIPRSSRIVVEEVGEGFSSNAQVGVLIHELAHALVRLDRREEDPRLGKASEEVVVESVAYCVCAAAGLDTSSSSVPYVAGWAEASPDKPIEAYAELIDRLARRLEEVVVPGPGKGD
jgi:antirestriction protein ArdC